MTVVNNVRGMVHTSTRYKKDGSVYIVSKSYADTASFSMRSKTVSLLPVFRPNTFNIKPYAVAEFQISDVPSEVNYDTHLSDGSRVAHNWKYSGGPQTTAVTGLDKSVPNLSRHIELAMQEAYAKVNGSIWDVGVDLAELGEVADLIPSLVKGPRKVAELGHDILDFLKGVGMGVENHTFKQLARQIGRTGKELPQQIANMHLTYRYGLMPALLSVNDALELLRSKIQKASNAIHTKRRRKSFKNQRTQAGNFTSQPYTYVYDTSSRIEAIVYYRRKMDETTESQLGLVPENIPSILWESTKLSFVWDWVLNIGAWLEALKPKFGVDILGYTTSYSHDQNHQIIQLNPTYDQSRLGYVTSPSRPVLYHGKEFRRSVVDGPKALPVFTALDNMNLIRTIDAAALALKPLCNKIKQLRK